MTPLAIALALFAQDAPAAAPATEAAPPATASEDRWPTGAPREDYQFVAWCYGALRGYLDMHDEVIPEVTRIEKQFRKPGTKLEDDMKVYADMQKDGRAKLKLFQSALTAAEKASVRPINTVGAEAVKQGRSVWNAGPEVTKARKAQEWMSWALPAKCETTASALEQRSLLAAATLRGAEPEVPAADPAPAEPPAPPAETPPGV
ncbi:hypothetical protein ACO2Q0_16445 [Phenylobacterium sp. VNQ135]|uniref:hypothetical protein n=1 Tax=Phenylobacterium sp. VNQ135 TaxID=3400922 RepID=UPI003BFC13D8